MLLDVAVLEVLGKDVYVGMQVAKINMIRRVESAAMKCFIEKREDEAAETIRQALINLENTGRLFS